MKKTKNQLAYEREVRRLTRFIKSAQRQGIIFDPNEPPLPPSPARITQKKLREMQLMTKSEVLSRGYQVDTETGELTQFKPAPSRKRYLSQIKPILTPSQVKKRRKEAAAKGQITKRTNELLREYKLPESDRDAIRRLIESKDLTEDQKLDVLKKHAHFYNPHDFPLEPAEPEPVQPPAPEVPAPPTEIPPEYYDVPDPDDFSEEPADGDQSVIGRIMSLLTNAQNTNIKEVIETKINEKIESEGADAFVQRVKDKINRVSGLLYSALVREYKQPYIADAAYEALAVLLGEDPISLQEEISDAAELDSYDSMPYRRR